MIDNYVKHIKNAMLISESQRYDIKGKSFFSYPSKFYYEDTGLRNARLNYRQIEPGHLIENILYNELIRRGFSVYVGAVPIRETNNIEYVEIYAEGCAVPPTLIIDDSRTIKSLVTSITDIWGYRRIPKERYLEGLCNIWIKFSNGVCVGTYKDINQGYIDLELRATGGPFYKLPKKFRENVLELLDHVDSI